MLSAPITPKQTRQAAPDLFKFGTKAHVSGHLVVRLIKPVQQPESEKQTRLATTP